MKQCTCYALRAIDCTCLPEKYDEIYTTPDQEPVALQVDVIVVNLVREGINKHRARELAEHFIKHTTLQQRTWVGLTAADRKEIERQSVYVDGAIRMTEAKLKQKNGYAEENT